MRNNMFLSLSDALHGKEVLIRKDEKDTWKIHYFDYVGKDGFYSIEGKNPMQYLCIMLPSMDLTFFLEKEKKHLENELYFQEYLKDNEVKK